MAYRDAEETLKQHVLTVLQKHQKGIKEAESNLKRCLRELHQVEEVERKLLESRLDALERQKQQQQRFLEEQFKHKLDDLEAHTEELMARAMEESEARVAAAASELRKQLGGGEEKEERPSRTPMSDAIQRRLMVYRPKMLVAPMSQVMGTSRRLGPSPPRSATRSSALTPRRLCGGDFDAYMTSKNEIASPARCSPPGSGHLSCTRQPARTSQVSRRPYGDSLLGGSGDPWECLRSPEALERMLTDSSEDDDD